MKFARRTRRRLCRGPLEVVGAEVAQGGVTASGVVPALDEFEERHARLGLGLKGAPVDEFALHGEVVHIFELLLLARGIDVTTENRVQRK